MSFSFAQNFPISCSDGVLIENPSNVNEIIYFGGYQNQQMLIYNIEKQTYNQLNTNIDRVFGNPENETTSTSACGMFTAAVKGLDPDTVILVGCGARRSSSFHVIFDSKELQFKKPIHHSAESVSRIHGCRVVRFKKWILITGGDAHVNHPSRVSIFDITKQTGVPMAEITLHKRNGVDIRYTYHGSVILSEDVDTNRIKMLLFGGCMIPFLSSFYTVSIDFDNLENWLIKDNRIQQTPSEKNGLVVEYMSFEPYWKSGLSCSNRLHNDRLWAFSHQCLSWKDANDVQKKRYLIIMGGNCLPSQQALDHIIYFDFERLTWDFHVNLKLPSRVYGHSSISQSKNQNRIRIIGGCTKHDADFLSHHWVLLLIRNIDWEVERQIWIGFEKNCVGNKYACLLPSLSKDVISYILSFLRGKSILQR